ncbi:hypothetical protein Pcinc_009867 [Petrolisthes cinctipes]|uniref:Uncharacterized protein n=1 Tax=Petrolisthes cinctipes TaxID=88211 RepID=A0AAE1KW10_PETCI|nr:hypothetical protein Pcinc_009867 [Petrolisthes cinctipes]
MSLLLSFPSLPPSSTNTLPTSPFPPHPYTPLPHHLNFHPYTFPLPGRYTLPSQPLHLPLPTLTPFPSPPPTPFPPHPYTLPHHPYTLPSPPPTYTLPFTFLIAPLRVLGNLQPPLHTFYLNA